MEKEYKERTSKNKMVKIYFKGKPISSRRTLANTYENDFERFNPQAPKLITFEDFVEKHKKALQESSKGKI